MDLKINKKGMIKLGTLSDKLNHTADCKESIRQAVNQNLGSGAELIGSLTQFDQYSQIIKNINLSSNDIVFGELRFQEGNFSTTYNGSIITKADQDFNFSSYDNILIICKNPNMSFMANQSYLASYYQTANFGTQGTVLDMGSELVQDIITQSNVNFTSNTMILTNCYFLNGTSVSSYQRNNYLYFCFNT